MKRIWAGTLSFGLVNIPINLYSASSTKKLQFEYLHKNDKCKIGYQRICKETGEEVPYDEIVRGFEYTKGEYVVVTEEDFENADVRLKNSIEIISFTDHSQISPKYYQRPYYLEPDDDSVRMYALLRQSLKDTNKVGIARYVLRTREHLGVLQVEDDVIMLNQIRFVDELRDHGDLEIPGAVGINKRELQLANQIIQQLSEDFEPEKYKDVYTQKLLNTIQEKVEKRGKVEPKGEKPEPTSVEELSKRLKESLEKPEVDRFVAL